METVDFVQGQLGLQMPDPETSETTISVSPGTRGDQDAINRALDAFELKREDPTNVTAYHDFYNLQIAFEPIWTELFGRLEEAAIPHLGMLAFALADQLGPLEPINTPGDLEALGNDLGFLVDRIRANDEPPQLVVNFVQITPEEWRRVDDPNRVQLVRLAREAEEIDRERIPLIEQIDENNRIYRSLLTSPWLREEDIEETIRSVNAATQEQLNPLNTEFEDRRDQAERIITDAHNNPDRYSRLETLVQEISARLSGAHNFHTFKTDSINYGILVTYRQKWVPQNYQVGDLVSTIPLAPKEVRKFTKKQVVKKSRAVKEIENSLRIRKEDSQDTARHDAEIVNKAENKTNFKMAAEGGFSVGVANANASTGLAIDSARTSSQTKKDFREAVNKAAQEYKQERKLEISTTEAEEFEVTASGEISNPNDELPVTYLFYELQRQYLVSERIHRVTPVVLVANEVPNPDDIDEDWFVAHDWILRRVILDDSFLPALDFLAENVLGEEFTLDVLKGNLDRQKEIVDQTKEQVSIVTERRTTALETLGTRIERLALEIGEEGLDDDETVAREREMAETARENVERIERELRELQSQLGREVTALDMATEKYTQAFNDHLNQQTEIARLRIHVKENILYYMQAIWNHEPPDQRYFRLRHLKVLDITPTVGLSITNAVTEEVTDPETGEVKLVVRELEVDLGTDETYEIALSMKALDEVADLDNLLGYKGNYMIFPLKQNNFVTTVMMLPYVDEETGLREPDDPANYSFDELIAFIKWLHENEPEKFQEEIKGLRLLAAERLADPKSQPDLLVVPTDSLYIEALPGRYPILEDFKLMHRALDVKKVRAEVRHAELENIRLAARLMEKEWEDPDIEKRVIVSGDGLTPTVETNGEP